MEAELLASARYGELQELNDLWCAEIEQKADLWPTTNTDAQDRLCAWLTVKDEFGGNTMLHYACANHHADIVAFLLDLDKKHNAGLVNLKNKEGNTPLHWCTVTLSHATDKDAVLSITKGLLEAGASTLDKNAAQHSPLYYAESIANPDEKDYEVIQLLLAHSEQLDDADGDDVDDEKSQGEDDQTTLSSLSITGR